VRIPLPYTRVRYELQLLGEPTLEQLLAPLLPSHPLGPMRDDAAREHAAERAGGDV
jgi:hypothetical protein